MIHNRTMMKKNFLFYFIKIFPRCWFLSSRICSWNVISVQFVRSKVWATRKRCLKFRRGLKKENLFSCPQFLPLFLVCSFAFFIKYFRFRRRKMTCWKNPAYFTYLMIVARNIERWKILWWLYRKEKEFSAPQQHFFCWKLSNDVIILFYHMPSKPNWQDFISTIIAPNVY